MRRQGRLAGLALFTLASADTAKKAEWQAYYDYTPNPSSDWLSFAPSGATEGFKCYYPYLKSSEWERCTHESRGCWIRQKHSRGYGNSGGRGHSGGYGYGGYGGPGYGGYGGPGYGGPGYGGPGYGGPGYGGPGYGSSGYGSSGYSRAGGPTAYGNHKTGGRYGWDVHTDYDDYAPVGVRRYYTLDVATNQITPDGVPKDALLFSEQFPGPLLEACWGDEIVVTVTNSLPNQGTTVHWHGVRQLFTNDQDGVPITQCPIARGESFTYRFRVTQYGTSWYHSHYSLQYADGLSGPIIFHGPSSANYEHTVPEPLLMTDWVHGPAEVAYQQEKNPANRGVNQSSILLNGLGRLTAPGVARSFTNGDIRTAYPVISVVPGKKNRIRIINTSIATAFIFSIDGHNLTVIGNDFIAVKPYTTKSIPVAIGQRYEIIIHAHDRPNRSGKYWIRTQPANGCNKFSSGVFNTRTSPPSIPFDVRTGVLHYQSPHTSLSTLPTTMSTVTDFEAVNLKFQSSLIPVVPWQVNRPLNNVAESTFYAAHQNANETGLGALGNYAHWQLRLDPIVQKNYNISKASKPFWIEFAKPTLLDLGTTNPYYSVLHYTTMDKDGYIYMIIDGALLPSTPPSAATDFFVPPVTHPMHWHGSDVVVLGYDTKPFDPNTSPKTWRYDNPPRRDTVSLPAGGYLAVAFRPENPGVWLVHCHIAWHASGGLALQMIIQDDPKHIYRVLGQSAINDVHEGCKAWNRDVFRKDLQPIKHKDDSGI